MAYKSIGKSVTRLDAIEKVIGTAKFCSDFMLGTPGSHCISVPPFRFYVLILVGLYCYIFYLNI